MRKQRDRMQPRMSLNKLGEYLTATKPGRRRSIIRAQRKPKDFIVARYADAERAIKRFITAPTPDADILRRAAASLSAMADGESWSGKNAGLCTKALMRFMSIADDIPTNGYIAKKGDNYVPKFRVEGVDISVRPEILLTDPDTGAVTGAIKLYLVQDPHLSDDALTFVSTVLYRYLAEHLSSENAVDHRNCFVVDVFAGRIFQAPKTFKRNMGHVRAACNEIATIWAAA